MGRFMSGEGSNLVYLGAGAHGGAAGGSAGLVGFSSGGGAYVEGSALGQAAGFGVYVNVVPNGGCPAVHP